MPLVSGRPPRSRWSYPPLSPRSLSLLVNLRHQAVQDETGDLIFRGPGDETLLLAADDVDLVLGGAESYAFSGDIIAHHEVRSLSCELLAGVGHGVPVRRRESYHKEVGILFSDGLENVGCGGKLQARRPCTAPDLRPYPRGRREVRYRCGHDERVRVGGTVEYSLSQLLHGLHRMVPGPRLDSIYVGGHYGNPGAEPQSFAGHCQPHLPRGAIPDKTHAVYGLSGAAGGHEQPQPAHRAAKTTEYPSDDLSRGGHPAILPLDDAATVFSEESEVLSYGGVACRPGVEIRGHDSARREAGVHAAGEPGQSIHGCRSEEQSLRGFRGIVYQGYLTERRGADE